MPSLNAKNLKQLVGALAIMLFAFSVAAGSPTYGAGQWDGGIPVIDIIDGAAPFHAGNMQHGGQHNADGNACYGVFCCPCTAAPTSLEPRSAYLKEPRINRSASPRIASLDQPRRPPRGNA